MPTWGIGFILKRVLPALLILSVLGYAVTKIEAVGYRRGYDYRWAETLPGEIRDDYARAKLADDAMWRTRIADFTMLVSSLTRENAYARDLAAAAVLTDGLAGRVRDAENRLQGGAVPGGCAGNGAEVSGDTGATGAGRLRALEQRVYDACGADGAALEAFGSKPVCECPTSAVPR